MNLQPWKLPKLQRKGPTYIDHCMTARCVVHNLCSTVLHAIQNWLGSNINFSSRQQNKIQNHNRNKNHHFSGHQTLPVLPLQNQNFRQILSQKVGLEFSAFSLDQDAIFNSHFATSVSKGRLWIFIYYVIMWILWFAWFSFHV